MEELETISSEEKDAFKKHYKQIQRAIEKISREKRGDDTGQPISQESPKNILDCMIRDGFKN
ncbi:MAG: hypothetical protein PVH63_13090 [Balneolaceae bacterium]|jgi:hypothetical protein